MISLNNDWLFTQKWSEAFLHGDDRGTEEVRIPHTVAMMPLHYGDDNAYQMISGYKRKVRLPEEAEGKRVFLQFDGAAHIATVYVNGKEITTHKGGYTAFRAEITDFVSAGEEFELAVRLDSTENGSIPPFGYVIDYLTYGGIYRPVWLDIEERECISDVFVTTPELNRVHLAVTVSGGDQSVKTIRILSPKGKVVLETKSDLNELDLEVKGVQPWDVDSPVLYTLEVSLDNGSKK